MQGKWLRNGKFMLVAMVLVLTVMAGCSGSNSSNKEADDANVEKVGGESAKVPLKFNLWLGWSATMSRQHVLFENMFRLCKLVQLLIHDALDDQ